MPEPEYQRLFLPDYERARREHFLSGRVQELRQVVSEGGVTVRMVAERVAIEPHIGIHINAVELDGDPLSESLMVEHEMLAIPAGAAERVARGRAAGAFRRERPDHRKIRRAPSAATAGCGGVCPPAVPGAQPRAVRGGRRQVFEAPVMGQVEGSPGGVIESGVFRAGCVRSKEAPAGVEGKPVVRRVVCGRSANAPAKQKNG